MENGFERIHGISERMDCVARRGTEYYLYWGQGKDDLGDFVWRRVYGHKPTAEELRSDITALVNRNVDERILAGYEWNGKPVYLSSENQFNYKSVYDLALRDSSVLPLKFKMGEDAEGNVVYHTFATVDELSDFYVGAIQYINRCINDGWTEKDSIDPEKLLEGAE